MMSRVGWRLDGPGRGAGCDGGVLPVGALAWSFSGVAPRCEESARGLGPASLYVGFVCKCPYYLRLYMH